MYLQLQICRRELSLHRLNRQWKNGIALTVLAILFLFSKSSSAPIVQGTIPLDMYLPVVQMKPFAGITTRVSVTSDGTQGNGHSGDPSISADGRYVTFFSDASNLVIGDTNGQGDAFVYDRTTGDTSRVSVASSGEQAIDGGDVQPRISPDGRFVTFKSMADNLVDGDTNDAYDVFVHDQQTGETTRVSVSTGGVQANRSSDTGSISYHGRYVAFSSLASNLVGGDTNESRDAFVNDRLTGETTRVSVASDGTQGNGSSASTSISADGRFVVINSDATNLVSNDINGKGDAFVHDRHTGETTRVSVSSDGAQAFSTVWATAISGDGRYVAMASGASNLVSGDTNGRMDVFVHDRQTGETTRVSVASDGMESNNYSSNPSISENGRFVAFGSYANNLVTDDTNDAYDVFIHDLTTAETTLISVATDGTQSNGSSQQGHSILNDGGAVAFGSYATNLVKGDTNGTWDIFVHTRPE